MAPNSNQQSQELLVLVAFNGLGHHRVVSSSSSLSCFCGQSNYCILTPQIHTKRKRFRLFSFNFWFLFYSPVRCSQSLKLMPSNLSFLALYPSPLLFNFIFQLLYLISKRSNGIMTFCFVFLSLSEAFIITTFDCSVG